MPTDTARTDDFETFEKGTAIMLAVLEYVPVPYLSAISSLIKTQAAQDWENAKDNIGALTAEATVATFLAAVQAQLIALSYQDNSTRLKVATNALGFSGLLLDVITACLALLASSNPAKAHCHCRKTVDCN
ncbi:hypothetical protein B0H14DRAFT_171784 [Mycena olivaceomarginata]|nr:hypothetical protein B0H14DRAFT_171784 [Mycena olivaceomarginata]